jgi:hypothetical protein
VSGRFESGHRTPVDRIAVADDGQVVRLAAANDGHSIRAESAGASGCVCTAVRSKLVLGARVIEFVPPALLAAAMSAFSAETVAAV